jgi:hypothetical protein
MWLPTYSTGIIYFIVVFYINPFNSWRVCGLRCIVLPRSDKRSRPNVKTISYSPEATWGHSWIFIWSLTILLTTTLSVFYVRKLFRLRSMPWAKLIEHCMLYTNAAGCNKVGIERCLEYSATCFRIFHLLSSFAFGVCGSAQLHDVTQEKRVQCVVSQRWSCFLRVLREHFYP